MRLPDASSPICLAAALCLLVAGCGGSDGPVAQLDVAEATIEEEAALAGPAADGDGRLTAVDAATGDGAALPGDSYAPSAYDLALAAAGPNRSATDLPATPASETDRSAVATPAASALPGADQPVTSGG